MKLTIYRDKWLRGEFDSSMLLRPDDGKMCCVGFLSVACGVPKEELAGEKTVARLVRKGIAVQGPLLSLYAGSGNASNTGAAQALYSVNDAKDIDEAVREARIRELMADIGVEVEFKGTEGG